MKKMILTAVATVFMSGVAQAQMAPVGFICQYTTASGKSMEIAGFKAEAKKLPKKYNDQISSGQVIALQDSGKNLIFDLTKFAIGASGFAGRNILIQAEGNGQVLQIKAVTGSSDGVIGTLSVSKGNKVLTSGSTKCELLSNQDIADKQDSEDEDNIW